MLAPAGLGASERRLGLVRLGNVRLSKKITRKLCILFLQHVFDIPRAFLIGFLDVFLIPKLCALFLYTFQCVL